MSEKKLVNKQEKTFFEFPCKFPIKVMANHKEDIVIFITKTLIKFGVDESSINLKKRSSKTEKYISITAIFTATSKKQLDEIYQTLSSNDDIHMVL